MGKFDGILICSDLDGTFSGQGIEAENQKSIEYFIENGGRFSFATGRTVDYILGKPYFSVINAPTCLVNGAVVYDYSQEKVIREVRLAYTVREFLDNVKISQDDISRFVVFKDVHGGDGNNFTDISEIPDEYLDCYALKLLCVFKSEEAALKFKNDCLNLKLFDSTHISRSWNIGVEFNNIKGTKGEALRFIKEYLGDIKTSVGIGNYENDLTLITHADIGVAVENATPDLKEAADMSVCHFSLGAMKDLVARLEGESV